MIFTLIPLNGEKYVQEELTNIYGCKHDEESRQ